MCLAHTLDGEGIAVVLTPHLDVQDGAVVIDVEVHSTTTGDDVLGGQVRWSIAELRAHAGTQQVLPFG